MRVLIVAAHPDDEVLGCGGTIQKLVKKGYHVTVVFAANGVSGRKGVTEKEIDFRKKDAMKVARQLGIEIDIQNSYLFNDQRLDQEDYNKIVEWLEKVIKRVKPEIVFTHFIGDLNRDHRIIAEASMVACRPSVVKIKKLYAYEIPESTENSQLVTGIIFSPNVYFAVNKQHKVKLMNLYRTEVDRSNKWEKGISALGQYRGFSSGLDFAEGFMLLREIND